MPLRNRWMPWAALWLAGVVLLMNVPFAMAQTPSPISALVTESGFAALSFTTDGVSPARLQAPVGAPVVLQVRNLDTQPHCLAVQLPASSQLPELLMSAAGRTENDCPPAPIIAEEAGVVPTPLGVRLDEVQAAVQCGPRERTTDRLPGTWGYSLPAPLLPGERATLCFIVTAPGAYTVLDPTNPTLATTLFVGNAGAAGDPAQTIPATPTPVPDGSPDTLPTTGARLVEGRGAVSFWLLLGIWTLTLATLFRRTIAA